MQCPHCHHTIPDASHYCAYCGMTQAKPRPSARRWPFWAVALIALATLGRGWLLGGTRLQPTPQIVEKIITQVMLVTPGPGPLVLTSTIAAGLAILAPTAAIVQTPTPTAGIILPTVTLTSSYTPTASPASSSTPTASPVLPTATSAPTATSTPARIPTSTAPPTSVPIASRTPTPAPATAGTSSYPAPVLVSPADNATVSGRTTFIWQWNGPVLAADQAFEVRIWREGQPDHYGAAGPTNSTRIEIDLPGAYGVAQGGAGVYFWTVAVVQVDPYQRTGEEAPRRRLQVNFAREVPQPPPTHAAPEP